jgi:hypothetical protein
MLGPSENWGPFHSAISHAERVARLRGLRAITELYCGKSHALVKALWLAETGDAADLEGALLELDRLPALQRRRVLGSYAAHAAFKAQREANDGGKTPMQLEGGG